MKTIITVIVSLLSSYIIFAQKPNQQSKKDFDGELEIFTSNITSLNSEMLKCYQDFHNAINLKPLRIMKSKRSYPPLIPLEVGIISKITKLVPKEFIASSSAVAAEINPVAGLFIGLLNQGWDAHNKEAEAKRKEALINETIQTYLNNQVKKDEYIVRMDKFLRRVPTQPSIFEEKLTKLFYQSDNLLESEKIYNELFDLNRRMEKHPIIANKNSPGALIANSIFYEDFINQYLRVLYNDVAGSAGTLYGYIELTSSSKIKNKILVPDVPAGYEIGERFNSILPKIHKKPLDLKVVKVLRIKSVMYRNGHKPKIGFWHLTLDNNNYIRKRFLTKMIANEPFLNPQPETGTKHAYEFLEKYGEYDKKIGLWKIPSSLFSEFTKNIPEGMKPPTRLREMIEL